MGTVNSEASRLSNTRAKAIVRSPGTWLLFGGMEILLLVNIAEFLYPGYSTSSDYISDLGIGPMPSSAIFTVAVILFGVAVLVSAALLRQGSKGSWIWLLLVLCGIGAVGVGLFNEDYPILHRPSAFLAFFFGNLTALYSFRSVRPPISYVFALLGLIGLTALVLYGSGTYLGLGVGGMERMILYPAVLWAIGFGSYQLAEEGRSAAP